MRSEIVGAVAKARTVVRAGLRALRPPPILTISQWADQFYYLSAESSAVPGKWTTLPYQREPLDAMGDPLVSHVIVMKSARVGYTLMMLAALGYHMHQDPAGCLVIQPTLEDARGFSKDNLQPMIRDNPVLAELVHEDPTEGAGNTMLQMRYPGGVISLIGANSGTGLRRISRRFIASDEMDAYPTLIGEGDVIKLAQKRSEYYFNRRFLGGSTPLIAGLSRIEAAYEEGDARKYFVPCPHCGHEAPFVFRGEGGHSMKWPEGNPAEAFFACQLNGCVIEEKDKRAIIERGEWRATKVGLPGHRSYHIWAALSYSPGATWAHIAAEFVEAKGNPERLRVFVNTTLGETWKQQGDAPDWERLYQLREHYPVGTVPEGVKFLTAGVDVQKDRFVFEVVGWAAGKESWSIDSGVIPADTSNEGEWSKLDAILNGAYSIGDGGASLAVRMLAVDSGYNTQMVYGWARNKVGRVIAIKGSSTARTLISAPTAVDVTHNGRRIARGCKVWPLGVDIAKAELYGWLRLQPPTKESGAPYPHGYCHFPELGEDYFKQLTGEHLVTTQKRTGYARHEWQLIPGRENHYLDCRVYARAAAAVVGLDRMAAPPAPVTAATPEAKPVREPAPPRFVTPGAPRTPSAPKPPRSDSRFRAKGGWLSRKR